MAWPMFGPDWVDVATRTPEGPATFDDPVRKGTGPDALTDAEVTRV